VVTFDERIHVVWGVFLYNAILCGVLSRYLMTILRRSWKVVVNHCVSFIVGLTRYRVFNAHYKSRKSLSCKY